MKSRTFSLFVLGILLALLLTACTSASPASQPPEPAPVVQPQAGSHLPVILRVVERQEVRNGFLVYYRDLYFTDADGDADYISLEEISSSLSYPYGISGGELDVPAQEQKAGAMIPIHWTCNQKMNIVLESRISDRLGNVSEPVNLAFSCTPPPGRGYSILPGQRTQRGNPHRPDPGAGILVPVPQTPRREAASAPVRAPVILPAFVVQIHPVVPA